MNFIAFVKQIAALDGLLFNFINDTLYMQWLADFTFFLARDQIILLFLLGGGLFYFGLTNWKKTAALMLWSSIAVVSCNLLQNNMFKPFFNRTRPFMSFENVHLSAQLRDLSMVSLSFPSTHAASSAALAVIMWQLDSKLKIPGILFALTVGFFTVYSGGHFPLDVLAGYMVGITIGLALGYISRLTWPGHRSQN